MPTKAEDLSGTTDADVNSRAPSSAFAASGFAALASSSTSPFGVLGASSVHTAPRPFGLSKPLPAEQQEAQHPRFGHFAIAPLSGVDSAEASPFAAATSIAGQAFGNTSGFGGGFGTGLSGRSKLTSFAATTGDTKLVSANGGVKPIGPPVHDSDEKYRSDSETDGTDERCKDDQTSETDDRFQQQDGKVADSLSTQ